ncbi:hypothetical protein [Budvicia aquatica]|uniref:Uncharacterized protein n=1 Tax=Budvicia aquatica TaxID=82979 RepID=A0A2C6CZX9_9GAMM|nr:hypothetical protein [Budvicia aquatica]PHI32249.1 hypothetical protein CRN84_24475 [Budvicia aquatica]VFS45165.1 Uncharacterised protein [Budvicia aquatica]
MKKTINTIFKMAVVSLSLATLSASASPYGDADVLFGCFIQKGKTQKEVVVLKNDENIIYMYGKQDPNGESGLMPEITIKTTVSQIAKEWLYSQVDAVSIHNLNIPNGPYTYQVSYTEHGNEKYGYLTVLKNGNAVSLFECQAVWEQNLNNDDLMKDIPDVK